MKPTALGRRVRRSSRRASISIKLGEAADTRSAQALRLTWTIARAIVHARRMHPSPHARPSFARDFPRTDAIDALVHAFACGNYALVRREAPKVIHSEQADDVRSAARTLLERTKPDPLAVRLLWIAAALLVALTAYWVVNGKAPPPEASHPSRELIP